MQMSPLRDANTLKNEPAAVSLETVEADSGDSWQRDLSRAFRDPRRLLISLGFSEEMIADVSPDANSRFPTVVPESYRDRMNLRDPFDPLLLQVLPQNAENLVVDGFVSDAVDDQSARIGSGLLQKYQGRVLLIASGTCAVHCRYCFRRDYPYAHEPRQLRDWLPAVEQIRADNSITEVILSGGDPLILTDQRLRAVCHLIDAIPHVERIRFHTRMPIVLPSRITDSLIAMLLDLRTQPIMVVHANHGNEIQRDCTDALRRLVLSGIPTLNQSVLLKGINDSAEALEALSRRLINLGVMPYYLHQLDHVSGTAHFDTDPDTARSLIKELARRLPGYAVPKLVRERPGEPYKSLL